MPEAAYWATYSGYRMADPVLTLRYRHLALRDTLRTQFTLQYMSEARQWLHDDSLYMETLREGFRRFPTNNYFFPRLLDYYTAHGQYELALQVADTALQSNDSSQLYRYAKATVLFNMNRYDESIALCDTMISCNDSLPDPYYLAGTAYVNKALRLHPLREKKQVKNLYQKARPYMERYRELAPDQKQKWAPVLYRVYLNLNMGRQFDEIDRLLK
jgi:tetratricopeptide (TPR) repeat protein